LALLAAAIWFAVSGWSRLGGNDVPPMPLWGWVALAVAVIASIGVGAGLMALMFYSSRHGYDEAGEDKRR
jgi:hypothetical protein